jgi:hypothetical protein
MNMIAQVPLSLHGQAVFVRGEPLFRMLSLAVDPSTTIYHLKQRIFHLTRKYSPRFIGHVLVNQNTMHHASMHAWYIHA